MDNGDAKNFSCISKLFEYCFNQYVEKSQNKQQKIQDDFFEKFTENVIIPNKHNIPPLFRYSPADYYNIRNLENETLMLSDIGNMNDIFEGLSGEVNADVITSLSELNDIAFVKSFTERKNDFLMWSHYGDRSAGMCVEYDFSKLADDLLYHLFPIVYSEQRYKLETLGNAVTELYELKKANKEGYYPDLYGSLLDIMSLFLRKPSNWSMEKEWRLIATYPQIYNSSSDFYNIEQGSEYPLYTLSKKTIDVKNCIKSVYIGPRMQDMQRKHIKDIGEKLKIEIHELKISKTEYVFEEK